MRKFYVKVKGLPEGLVRRLVIEPMPGALYCIAEWQDYDFYVLKTESAYIQKWDDVPIDETTFECDLDLVEAARTDGKCKLRAWVKAYGPVPCDGDTWQDYYCKDSQAWCGSGEGDWREGKSDYFKPVEGGWYEWTFGESTVHPVGVCTQGERMCDGYTLLECQNGRWVPIEENSNACGYEPGNGEPPEEPAPRSLLIPMAITLGIGLLAYPLVRKK